MILTLKQQEEITRRLNAFYYYNHGIKVQKAYAIYMNKRYTLYKQSVNWADMPTIIIQYRLEYESVESSEIALFNSYKDAKKEEITLKFIEELV